MSFSRFQNTIRRQLSSGVIGAFTIKQLRDEASRCSVEKCQETIRGIAHSKKLTNKETLSLYGDLVEIFIQDRLYKNVVKIFRVLPHHGFQGLTSDDVRNFKNFLKDDDWIHASASEARELQSSHYTMFEDLKKKVIWTAPQEGFVKLNTDASIEKGQGAIGGLFRDSGGNMLLGFYRHIGPQSNIFEAEVQAIQEGLVVALEHGYTKLEIETDHLQTARILQGKEEAQKWKAELEGIIEFLSSKLQDSKVPVHIFRHANKCADSLAAIAINVYSSESETQIIFEAGPFTTLKRRLEYDQRRLNEL